MTSTKPMMDSTFLLEWLFESVVLVLPYFSMEYRCQHKIRSVDAKYSKIKDEKCKYYYTATMDTEMIFEFHAQTIGSR